MTKVFVFTKGPGGTTLQTVSSEEGAIRLCVYAIAVGCTFAFYSR